KEPNTFFAQEISKIKKPGKLLLPMEGEGRNAVFAAKLGWEVYAFDYSEQDKIKALQLAKMEKVSINFVTADASEYQPENDLKFDFIALIFAHLPEKMRKTLHQNCIKWLNPRGVILVESFHPKQLKHPSGGPQKEELL